MIKEAISGFCMALADSVPGVSGGTVAFIMGFYDQFIGATHDLAFGKMAEKKKALGYLIKLGIGWMIGMLLAVIVLSALFESHIYVVSSLFMGFIAGAIPLIIMEEKEGFRQFGKGVVFLILGIVLVAGIAWLNGQVGTSSMDLSHFSLGLSVKLFFNWDDRDFGDVSAGYFGFHPAFDLRGVYPVVFLAVRAVLSLELSYVPNLVFFGLGSSPARARSLIMKVALEKFRPQTLYLILGMMIGSFYAIIQGPTTLEEPQAPLAFSPGFNWIACIAGLALVLGMQYVKEKGFGTKKEA